jgi:hypothetical protein
MSADLRAIVPEKFWGPRFEGNRPVAGTVAELRQLLSQLPDDLSVQAFGADDVTLVVCNIGPTAKELRLKPCLTLLTEE